LTIERVTQPHQYAPRRAFGRAVAELVAERMKRERDPRRA
jgi:hypothetical protein